MSDNEFISSNNQPENLEKAPEAMWTSDTVDYLKNEFAEAIDNIDNIRGIVFIQIGTDGGTKGSWYKAEHTGTAEILGVMQAYKKTWESDFMKTMADVES